MFFLTVLLIPVFIALGVYICSDKRITFKEFLLHIGIQIVVAAISGVIVYYSNTSDYEIWNGRIAAKSSQHVSCEHSYDCFCYNSCSTDSNGNQSCHEVCQTCYEHTYDIDWNARTTNGESIYISRVDRQGTTEPPRWTSVKVGEPTAVSHHYENYVAAASDSLFRKDGIDPKYASSLLPYPDSIYDLYRVDRIVGANTFLDKVLWQRDLDELNADLGAKKQCNVILSFVRNQPEEYFYALEKFWKKGKKNDIVVVFGLDQKNNIQWTNTMAWTDKQIFKVKLRDDIKEIGVVDREEIFKVLRKDISEFFVRKPMSDFVYLRMSITPTFGQWLVTMIIGILVAIGLAFFLYNEDPFGDSFRQY